MFEFSEAQKELIKNGEKGSLPGVILASVIFGYHDKQLKVLLGRHFLTEKTWVLPGGSIREDEPLDQAAARVLKDRTSLDKVYLEQFYTAGSEIRRSYGIHSVAQNPEFVKLFGEDNWLRKRTIIICYYALLDYSKVDIKSDPFYTEFRWHSITELPKRILDKVIIDKALETLRNHLYLQPIGSNLLPEKFTLPEIHALYETILNKELDRRNFPKKLISLGIIKKLNEKRKIGQHRSPYLYKFDKDKYETAFENGEVLTF